MVRLAFCALSKLTSKLHRYVFHVYSGSGMLKRTFHSALCSPLRSPSIHSTDFPLIVSLFMIFTVFRVSASQPSSFSFSSLQLKMFEGDNP